MPKPSGGAAAALVMLFAFVAITVLVFDAAPTASAAGSMLAMILLGCAFLTLVLLLSQAPAMAQRAKARRDDLHRIDSRPMIAQLGAALDLRVDLAPGVARGMIRGFGVLLEPSARGMRFCVRGLPPGLSLAAPRAADGARSGDPVLDGLGRLHGNVPSWRARLDVATRTVLVRVLMNRRGLTMWDGVLQWVSPEPIRSVAEGRAVVEEMVDVATRLQLAEDEILSRLQRQASTDPSAGVREACVQELAAMPLAIEDRRALWTFASKDVEPSVRLGALPVAPSAADAEELVLGVLDAADGAARARALVWLARDGTARALPLLARIAERATGTRARSAKEVARTIEARLGDASRGRLSAPDEVSGALSDPAARAGQVTIVSRK